MSRADGDSGFKPSTVGARLAELDQVVVDIEKLVSGGEGLARFEGIPIFVPLSAPGDRLRIRIVQRRPHYGRGEILQILDPGPLRRQPPCPHFAACGGCDLQHLEDDAQSRVKADSVCETLERLGGLRLEEAPRLISGAAWGYRLRTQVHVEVDDTIVRAGYRRRRSHRIIAVESCAVCRPELEAAVVGLASGMGPEAPRRVDLAVGDEGVVTAAPVVADHSHGRVHVTVAGFELAFDARCFFQGHSELLPSLVESVVGDWSGGEAFDLYGGVGLFALPCSRRYERVVLVESDAVAARYARINGRKNRREGLEVEHRAVESWIGQLPEQADRVIVDPPRAGLPQTVRATLSARQPKRLTYVSCHPAALARDLRDLIGEFELESLTLIDLFPQTSHIESVAQLVRSL